MASQAKQREGTSNENSGIQVRILRRTHPFPGMLVTPNVRLVRRLAEGGMGAVWVADHLGLEAQVAVKFLDPELLERHPAAAARFKREASLSARLSSVHVVRTFDSGRMADGTPYIVMELLEGSSLSDWLEVCGVLSLRETALVVKQVAKALQRAHVLGIVHRDIKPCNIFLCDNDYDLFVKVLDFGVAKRTWDPSGDAEMTKTGVVVGTAGYMSPEQAVCSKGIDHRADLWSLAAVAYRALTGVEPYADDASDLPFARMMRCDLTPPTHLDPTLPYALDDWFERALHPDPDRRFESADELSRTFAEIIVGALGERLSRDWSGELAPRSLRRADDDDDDADDDDGGDDDDDEDVDPDDTPTRRLGPIPGAVSDEVVHEQPVPAAAPFPYSRVFAMSIAVSVATMALLTVLGRLAALW